ncbi:MAG: shikimate kinase [Eubacteriales bacterium]|nr:shikimate kinase [Eubacteriales bacterium]
MDLKQVRKEIDQVDKELSQLYDRREELTRQVSKCKKGTSSPILNVERENEILDKWAKNNPFKRKFFMNLMTLSRNLQTKVMLDKHIVLIGMLGCGKSTAGKIVSNALDIPLKDVDNEIEKRENMTIAQIFEGKSEKYFRQIEKEEILRLAQNEAPTIISTGGGVVLNAENMKNLKENGIVFFIHRTPDEIIRHINTEKRPLLKDGPEKLYEIYDQRIHLYKGYADYIIEKNAFPNTTAGEIINILQTMDF